MAGDIENVWQEIEFKIDPKAFCTSCKISPINQKAKSKHTLKPKASLKWVLWILFQQQYQNV